jgi:cytochrome c nitrite reductase small subunit
MRKLILRLIPPDRWKLPVIVLLGIFAGLFSYAFYVSRAPSYLSDNPQTCVNCHVMAPQYATWQHSSHREVANCNDCHVPHNNIFNHYLFKAKDGMRHATIFTLRNEPQVIHIKEAGRDVVQNNCIRCHGKLFTSTAMPSTHEYDFSKKLCWDCHRETPHGRVNSLSSVPNARVPVPESPVPDWLKKYTQ